MYLNSNLWPFFLGNFRRFRMLTGAAWATQSIRYSAHSFNIPYFAAVVVRLSSSGKEKEINSLSYGWWGGANGGRACKKDDVIADTHSKAKRTNLKYDFVGLSRGIAAALLKRSRLLSSTAWKFDEINFIMNIADYLSSRTCP